MLSNRPLGQRGDLSLIGVIVAGAIGTMVMFATIMVMKSSFYSQRHLALLQDITTISRHITESVSCQNTLAQGYQVGTAVLSPVNTSAGPDCDPSSGAYKLLTLYDKNNHALTPPLQLTAGPFRYTGAVGEWRLLAQCDRFNNTLIIRAARPGNFGGFGEDPVNKRVFDFAGSPLYLFGGIGGSGTPVGPKLCQSSLGGSPPPTCPVGQFMTGMDTSGNPICMNDGTVGYLPYWATATTLANSLIFQDSAQSFLGFNTATPQVRFHFDITNQLLKFKGGNSAEISLEGSKTGFGSNTASLEFINNATGAWWHQTLRGDNRNMEWHYRNAGTTGIENRTGAPPSEMFRMWAIGANAGKFEAPTGFITASDRRLKTDIEPLGAGWLDRVERLRGVSFRWRNREQARRQMGVIAQEVEEVIPYLVTEDSEGFKRLDYNGLIPVLIEAVKELSGQCTAAKTLADELSSLRAEQAAQVRTIAELQRQVEALTRVHATR